MPISYIVSVVSTGLLAVLLLAVATEQARTREARNAVRKFMGGAVGHLHVAGGVGLATDRQQRGLCLVRADPGSVHVRIVPYDRVLGLEVLCGGQVVARTGRDDGFTPLVPAASSGARCCLRLVLDDGERRSHMVPMPNVDEAVRWHGAIKSILARQSAGRADRGKPDSRVGKGRRQPSNAALEQLRSALAPFVARQLGANPSFIIKERALRDELGVQLPLIHFHEFMNRLKRERYFDAARVSYSRKDGSWRFSRRA